MLLATTSGVLAQPLARRRIDDNPIIERYQMGKFIVVDYSRNGFASAEMFPRPPRQRR